MNWSNLLPTGWRLWYYWFELVDCSSTLNLHAVKDQKTWLHQNLPVSAFFWRTGKGHWPPCSTGRSASWNDLHVPKPRQQLLFKDILRTLKKRAKGESNERTLENIYESLNICPQGEHFIYIVANCIEICKILLNRDRYFRIYIVNDIVDTLIKWRRS